MKKKISVVVPTYRRMELMKRCLECLSLQEFNKDDFEIIIVSDGPDSSTRNMLNEFVGPLPFLQYIILPDNQGPAAARNAGWKAAQGRLIVFTDDDCIPTPLWLCSFWNEYERLLLPEYVAFTGIVNVPVSEHPTDYEKNTANLERADFITANCSCTKSALELIGGFDEQFRSAWREDSDLEFRLLQNGIYIYRKLNAVVVHPVRTAKWGVSIKEQRKTMFNALLFKKFPQLYREKIQSSPAWNYYFIIAGFAMLVTGLIIGNKLSVLCGAAIYGGLTIAFIIRRLNNTSRAPNHVLEMIATSLIIPFVSIYWTLYGSWKYKVLYY